VTDQAPSPPPPGGRVKAQASDQAQQANLGQGIQHNHFYVGGESRVRAVRPEVVADTLVPPPAIWVGREEELDRLRQARRQAQAAGRPVVLSAVHGMGGAGKTALARALAAEVAADYPDGRIEVDLFGFTPGHEPRDPGEVLGELLAQVGFDPADIPAHPQAKVGLWRSWLASRRVLLILDNARDAAQVQPLLPGVGAAGGCLVVVTSRNQLTELDAAARIRVDTLPPQDAAALLVEAAGRSRAEIRATGEELAELARLCGYLPLALRPVGALLARLSAAELIEVMRAADHPLHYLDEADRAARTAFTVSYQALSPALREVLGACAWHPGPDFDAGSLAALTAKPRPLAAVRLAELLQRNMLIGLPHGRYTFHDLFLGYARHHTGYSADDPGVRQARHRLYQHLTATTDTAISTLTTKSTNHTGNAFATPTQARTWLSAATGELTTAAYTALTDHWSQAPTLAHHVAHWLKLNNGYEQAAGLYTALHTTAQTTGDQRGQADALQGLGETTRLQDEYGRAANYYGRALQIYQDIGDRGGQADALQGLGDIARLQDEYGRAADYHHQALQIYQDIGDRGGQADALHSLGITARLQDEYGRAADYHHQALQIYQDIGDRGGQADALQGLGDIARLQDEYGRAANYYGRALQIYQDIGDRRGQANAHLGLALLAEGQGQPQTAAQAYQSAATLYTEIGFTEQANQCSTAYQRIKRKA